MNGDGRVAVFGGDDLRASIVALGLTPVEDEAPVAVVDATDATAVARAAALPADTPRVVVGTAEHRALLAAVAPRSVLCDSNEPAVLGPLIVAAMPGTPARATRVVVVTGVRGGVGRTLCCTNLARRLARGARVCLVDATGSGAAAWWLRCDARPWSDLEGLADEMSADHLAVVAHDAAHGLRLVGGPSVAPSSAIVLATVRAAVAADDAVIVDAPPVWDPALHALRSVADRRLVLCYDDPLSAAALSAAALPDDDWIVASQTRARRVGERDVFRALPRDEGAVASAFGRREAVGGALGRAYDDMAELIAIDAS